MDNFPSKFASVGKAMDSQEQYSTGMTGPLGFRSISAVQSKTCEVDPWWKSLIAAMVSRSDGLKGHFARCRRIKSCEPLDVE